MSLSAERIDWALELFAQIGELSTRRMMGGLCIYSGGRIFAILDSDGTVFVKARGALADRLRAAGSRQFGADSGRTMGYWTLPEDALEDAELAADWAGQALSAS